MEQKIIRSTISAGLLENLSRAVFWQWADGNLAMITVAVFYRENKKRE